MKETKCSEQFGAVAFSIKCDMDEYGFIVGKKWLMKQYSSFVIVARESRNIRNGHLQEIYWYLSGGVLRMFTRYFGEYINMSNHQFPCTSLIHCNISNWKYRKAQRVASSFLYAESVHSLTNTLPSCVKMN